MQPITAPAAADDDDVNVNDDDHFHVLFFYSKISLHTFYSMETWFASNIIIKNIYMASKTSAGAYECDMFSQPVAKWFFICLLFMWMILMAVVCGNGPPNGNISLSNTS